MSITLVTITTGENIPRLAKTVDSVKDLVSEVIIVYQGKDEVTYQDIRFILPENSIVVYTTKKGNADFDRDWAYTLAQSEWILALDDDEYIEDDTRKFISRIVKSDAEVVWFNFRNLVDGVNIKNVLGDDPHPRLWRRKSPPIINWPTQAHTHPKINSKLQYVAGNVIVHDRKFDDIMRRHEERSKVIGPEAVEMEKRFIEALKREVRR